MRWGSWVPSSIGVGHGEESVKRSDGVLVVVPCERRKVWQRSPGQGPVPAAEAYTGAPFVVNRAYAERFGDAWVVLSARYGFVPSNVEIPAPYDETFDRVTPEVVSLTRLREQVGEQGLDHFAVVVGLGGKTYRAVIAVAFAGSASTVVFPFAGLPIGKAMQAVNRAVASGEPGFVPPEDNA